MADPPLKKKTGNRLIQQMSPLLEGLLDMTDEDDLLVLSPTGILNSVPLHALFLGGRPLIERNLVVYTSSAAMLNQCQSRMNSESAGSLEEGNSTDDTVYYAVYEEPSESATERDLIFRHVEALSLLFPGRISLGPEVTKSRFYQESPTAKWVHYHGHARYSKEDILKSSLVLSDGRDVFSAGDESGELDLGRDELSVSEMFELNFPRGTVHFTVIACDSGTQDVAPGDEPMGIIPALLYAGATSVLGCQWPIDSRAGRAFSDAFYQEIGYPGMMSESVGKRTINLARALSRTIGKMRRGELGIQFKQAYYWAPFVLHGLWFFARKGTTATD